jgi:hypothetical protein
MNGARNLKPLLTSEYIFFLRNGGRSGALGLHACRTLGNAGKSVGGALCTVSPIVSSLAME